MNTVPAVFSADCANHEDFKPILKWITEGKGKMVYGGTTYKNELAKFKKYLGLIQQLQTAGKVVQIDDKLVDQKENAIKENLKLRGINENDSKYNDPHIVALVSISKVKLVTSLDRESYKFLRESVHYDSPSDRPSIYSRKRNSILIENPKYYGRCCK